MPGSTKPNDFMGPILTYKRNRKSWDSLILFLKDLSWGKYSSTRPHLSINLSIHLMNNNWELLKPGALKPRWSQACLGHTGRRRVVLDYTLNTETLIKTDEQKKRVLSKFMILCWATFIAILGHMWPIGNTLDTPGLQYQHSWPQCSILSISH